LQFSLQEVSPEIFGYIPVHGFTAQKTSTRIFNAGKASRLAR